MSVLDQSVVDERFCALIAIEGAPVDASELTGERRGQSITRTPQAVRELFSTDYLDLSAAAAEHGFAGLYVGVSDDVWERAVAQGTPSANELDTRLAMLMASLRIGAVSAMNGDEDAAFVWEPSPTVELAGRGTAKRLELRVSYIPGEHQVLLAEAASAI